MRGQDGFTLVEVVVGAAIGAMLLWCVLAMVDRTVAAARSLDVRLQGTAGVAHEIDRMASEAASALAVYVPSNDAFGNSNADGHEVDFYGQDASHRPYQWAYTYDTSAQTITRYAVGSGEPPVAGETVANINGFVATPASVNDLSNPASPAFDPLFAGVSATDVPYPIAALPGVVGGNRLVALHVTASGVDRRVMLASADAPTAFTVVVTYTPSPTPAITPTPSPLVMGT
jgi:prepilin-type N-terminal cleavage/methylation domain-containing protein